MSGQAGILEANETVSRDDVLAKMAPFAPQVAELRRRYPVPRGALFAVSAFGAGGLRLGAA